MCPHSYAVRTRAISFSGPKCVGFDGHFRHEKINTVTMDLLTGGGEASELGPRYLTQAGILQSGFSSVAVLVFLSSPCAKNTLVVQVSRTRRLLFLERVAC